LQMAGGVAIIVGVYVVHRGREKHPHQLNDWQNSVIMREA
jgi:hypothetical protein